MRSIGIRLLFAFLCVVLFLVAQGVFATIDANHVTAVQQDALSRELALADLRGRIAETRLTVFRILATMAPAEMDALRDEYNENMRQSLWDMRKLDIDTTLLQQCRSTYDEIIEQQYNFFPKTARTLIDTKSKDEHTSLDAALSARSESWSATNREAIADAKRVSRYVTASLTFAAVATAFVWAIVLARSLTDRRRSETQLQESEERFRQLAETIDQVFWVTTPDLKEVLYVSPAVETVWGLTPEELYERPSAWFEAIHPEDRKRIEAETDQHSLAHLDVEYRVRHADGSTRWVHDRGFAVRDADGEVYRLLGVVADVTRRKRAENALRESEERLQSYFSCSPDGIVILHDACFVDCNDAMVRMLGYDTRTQLVGRSVADTSPPRQRDGSTSQDVAQRLLDRAARGNSVRFEWEHRKQDGSELSVEVALTVLGDPAERRFLAVVRDLTERNRAERALRESERLFRAVFDQSFQLAGVLKPDGTVVEVNQTAMDIAGVQPAEITGRAFWDTPWWSHSPEEQARVRDAVARAATGEFVRFEAIHRRPNGESVIVDFSIKPVFDENGQVVLLKPESTDVTDRRRAEEQLRLAEMSLEHSGLVTIWFDTSGSVLRANDAACRSLGFERDELVGCGIGDFTPEFAGTSMWDDIWSELESSGTYHVLETKHCHKDGTTFPVQMICSRFRFAGQDHLFCLVRDISAQASAEAERRRLEEQLRESQKLEAVGRLAGGVAHDFNNILTAIVGNVELALDQVSRTFDGENELVKELRGIEDGAQRAATLTRQLLAFSRRQVVRFEPVNISRTVLDMERMLRRLIPENITLEVRCAPDLLPVQADTGQLEQIVMNLAINARDAMRDGGSILIETANVVLNENHLMQHPEASQGMHVALSIRDTGEGMDEETTKHIFEPFFTTKGPGKGTGLGLAMVYGIVRQSGGHIDVRTEEGRGTTFTVYLPATQTPEAIPTKKALSDEPLDGCETVLVCEDDEMVRNLAAQILRAEGYEVLSACGGEEALQAAEDFGEPIDLLLTDVIMPQMNGRLLAERLTERQPNLAVLFMSGYTSDIIAVHGVLDEGTEFLEKPFDRKQLLRKVREVLKRASLGGVVSAGERPESRD